MDLIYSFLFEKINRNLNDHFGKWINRELRLEKGRKVCRSDLIILFPNTLNLVI